MARIYEGIQIQKDTANGVIRELGSILEQFNFLQDFKGFDATEIEIALANAFTDVAVVLLLPGAYAVKDDYTIPAGKTLIQLPKAVITTPTGKTFTCTGTSVRFLDADHTGAGTYAGAGQLLITTTNT